MSGFSRLFCDSRHDSGWYGMVWLVFFWLLKICESVGQITLYTRLIGISVLFLSWVADSPILALNPDRVRKRYRPLADNHPQALHLMAPNTKSVRMLIHSSFIS